MKFTDLQIIPFRFKQFEFNRLNATAQGFEKLQSNNF